MPLRDHFRSPLDDLHSWDELHGGWPMDNWYHPLNLGQPLPTLPVWLTETHAVSLDLESSYEETCRALRIK
jgi:hypothetical protein